MRTITKLRVAFSLSLSALVVAYVVLDLRDRRRERERLTKAFSEIVGKELWSISSRLERPEVQK